MENNLTKKGRTINYLKSGTALFKIVKNKNGEFSDVKFVWMNKVLKSLILNNSEKIEGKKVREIFPEIRKSWARWKNIFINVGIKGKNISIDNYSNERQKWFNLNFQCPERGYVIAEVQEITKQKETEAEFSDVQNRFKNVFEKVILGIALVSPDYKFFEVNNAFCKIFGYSKKELKGKTFKDITHEEFMESSLKNANNLSKGKIPFIKSEKIYVTKSGKNKWINLTVSPIKGKEGKISYFLTVVEDINDRKECENRLKESEANMRTILDKSRHTFSIIDENFRVKIFNQSAKSGVRGIYKKELNKGDSVLKYLKGKHRKSFTELFKKCMAGEQIIVERCVKNNGKYNWFEFYYTPIKSSENGKNNVLIVGENITKRKIAEEKLKKSEEKFFTLFDKSPYYAVLTDFKGRYINVNDEFAKRFSINKDIVYGKNASDFGLSLKPAIRRKIFKEIKKSNFLKDTEIEFETISGEKISVIAYFDCFNIGNKKYILVIARDITKQKNTEAELAKKETEFKELTNSITDIFFALDKNLRYTYWNRASEIHTGILSKDAIGKSLREVFGNEKSLNIVESKYNKVIKTKKPSSFINEFALNGNLHFYEVNIYPSGNGISVFTKDITDRKVAEINNFEYQKQLKMLNEKLIKIREEERKSISREIHDDLGQTLTALKINLDFIKRNRGNNYDSENMIVKMTENIDHLIKRVQDISTMLRPLILDGLGAGAAIDWYVHEFSKETGIKTNISVDEDIVLNPDISIAIYRILQEAMTNIARHSKAENVSVTFRNEKNNVTLMIEDDGIGMDNLSYNPIKSLGILGMKERANQIKGIIDIQTSRGNGTKISLRINKNQIVKK